MIHVSKFKRDPNKRIQFDLLVTRRLLDIL